MIYKDKYTIFNNRLYIPKDTFYIPQEEFKSLYDIKEVYNICQVRGLQYRRIKNTLALLNQLIKYYQKLGVIEKTCNFQVKRLTDKNKFSINRINFEV